MATAYDAVVFDNDGVLTTPTDRSALLEAMDEAFDAVDVREPPDHHRETLLSPSVDSLQTIAAAHDVDPRALWSAREDAAIAAQLAEIEAGRKRLYDDIDALEDLETPTGIVSNNQHETIGNIVDHYGLDSFEIWYGREPSLEGIERKKPTPYYLERALADLEADDALYVGDSWVDIAAADAAGVDVAFIRRKHRREYELERVPTYEIEGLGELSELL
ncbi:HAD family hydrolase [Natronorubrum daqingense]|uniref:Haloacid dehalogenase superfamily, subfamily IA, variant 1 with third motif having Dx(3-4)D or Dx(3-4)E n=1 Tax=Natronorubrum daqingense TaxID=588898 RepID=A0A1N7C0D9_9EURY|nr:HAD-IA family hydrolase [Natronorubrum daqingense]APX96678.1 hydrolase [Natronorubrum daqingense]SIR57037.1 haloacid dehalogenase superfamily, subfamily IA, variant 1 with third motif having Dx(3-4)D or Dx(3-4)E [Natronorubrum daqingense]